MREMKKVKANYPFNGPNSTTLKQVINKPAASVFASFEDAAAWKEWIDLDVEWTSKKPFGVGTTRTVITRGQTIEELFLIWEAPHHMAFRFERGTLPLAAFAEDYKLTELSPTSCELAWTYAYEWGGPLGRVGSWLFGTVFARSGKSSLARLAKMMEFTGRYD